MDTPTLTDLMQARDIAQEPTDALVAVFEGDECAHATRALHGLAALRSSLPAAMRGRIDAIAAAIASARQAAANASDTATRLAYAAGYDKGHEVGGEAAAQEIMSGLAREALAALPRGGGTLH